MQHTILLRALFTLGLGLLASGCSSVNRGTPISEFGAARLQANLNRTDLEILGPVEGRSTKQSFVLGLVQVIDGDKWQVLYIKFFQDQYAFADRPWYEKLCWVSTDDRAFSKALAATPDADTVFHKSYIRSSSGVPLIYTKKESTFQGKAMKLKSDK